MIDQLRSTGYDFVVCDGFSKDDTAALAKAQGVEILARKHIGKKKAVEISVPYRPRVGDAEIHTWGDGWKNFKFLFAKRLGLNRTRTPWGGRDSNPDSNNKTLPEQ